MQIDLTNIKNIIFDLGNVLLNLDFDASIKAFQKLGLGDEIVNNQHGYADPVFYELEVGQISPAEFRKRVRAVLKNNSCSDQQIDDAWSAMIKDIPPHRVKKLQELGEKHEIYLFSNTNEIHIKKLLADFKKEHNIEFPSLFKTVYYSHDIHERKPDLISFEKVIQLSGVNPAESIFVDDLEKNILAAQKTGLKTLWLEKEMEMADLF